MSSGYGIKVIRSGKKIEDIDIRNLGFSSKFNLLNFYRKIRTSITTGATGSANYFVDHNLPYVPAFYSFIKVTATHPNGGSNLSNCYFNLPLGKHAWAPPGATLYLDDTVPLYTRGLSSRIQTLATSFTANTTFDITYFICANPIKDYGGVGLGNADVFGLKVSRPDISVLTANSYQVSISLKSKPIPIAKKGIIKISLSSLSAVNKDVQILDVDHNLGFSPFFIVFVQTPLLSNVWRNEPLYGVGPIDDVISSYETFVDAQRIRFSCYRNALDYGILGSTTFSAETVYFKYYLFNEPLNAD